MVDTHVKQEQNTRRGGAPEDYVIGRMRGREPGPTLIFTSGMHGNEPSGVHALKRLIEDLEPMRNELRGEILALECHPAALDAGVRYFDRDLNRMWKMKWPEGQLIEPGDSAEKEAFHFISILIDDAIQSRRGEVVYIDLHTTSAESPPFTIIGDTFRNRDFVGAIPVPVIVGLEEQLNGPLMSWFNAQGHVAFAFEAGSHTDPRSEARHRTVCHLVLRLSGALPQEESPVSRKHLDRLRKSAEGLNRLFELRYRYGIRDGEEFFMEPGYRNFQPVVRNEELAHSNPRGMIRAPMKGRIFMPLYQKQGDDGFFVIREVQGWSLRLARIARAMGLHKMLSLRPGIQRYNGDPCMLWVKPKVFRRLRMGLFRFFGYRRHVRMNGRVLLVKRHYDLHGPPH